MFSLETLPLQWQFCEGGDIWRLLTYYVLLCFNHFHNHIWPVIYFWYRINGLGEGRQPVTAVLIQLIGMWTESTFWAPQPSTLTQFMPSQYSLLRTEVTYLPFSLKFSYSKNVYEILTYPLKMRNWGYMRNSGDYIVQKFRCFKGIAGLLLLPVFPAYSNI